MFLYKNKDTEGTIYHIVKMTIEYIYSGAPSDVTIIS